MDSELLEARINELTTELARLEDKTRRITNRSTEMGEEGTRDQEDFWRVLKELDSLLLLRQLSERLKAEVQVLAKETGIDLEVYCAMVP